MSWDQWRAAFEWLLDRRFYTIDWLDGEIAAGRVHLLATDDAAVLVMLKTYPTGAMEVHGLAAAGNMAAIVHSLIPAAEKWGREAGCITATIESREGWARVMKPHGYELYQTTIRKEL